MIAGSLNSKTSSNTYSTFQKGYPGSNKIKRVEKKYVISKSLLPEVRDFICSFCSPDSNSVGNPPKYLLTTIQLDSLKGMLHFDNKKEAIGRSNLRIRTYGENENPSYFLEIKRKIEGSVLKERVMLTAEDYREKFVQRRYDLISFNSETEKQTFFDFIYWMKGLNLEPSMLIRYSRESYFDPEHPYTRLTIDSDMHYQNITTFSLSSNNDDSWQPIECRIGMEGEQEAFIFEVKTLGQPPAWIKELVNTFQLTSIKFCKYLAAVRIDHIHKRIL